MAFKHVIAENPVQIIDQMRLVPRFEQFKCLGINLHDADFLRARRHPRQIFQQKRPDVLDALRPPDIELAFHLAEILDPHRHRGKIEDIGIDRFNHTGSLLQDNKGGCRMPKSCETAMTDRISGFIRDIRSNASLYRAS
ncbi:hypothetical protein D3C87_1562020 [compost metagenome]